METHITKNKTFCGMEPGHGKGFSSDRKDDHLYDRLSQGEEIIIHRHETKE